MRMTFQEALDSLYKKYRKYGYEREFLADLLNSGIGKHEFTLKTISDSYKGDMFIKMRDRENSEHKARLDDLRKVAYRDIC